MLKVVWDVRNGIRAYFS